MAAAGSTRLAALTLAVGVQAGAAALLLAGTTLMPAPIQPDPVAVTVIPEIRRPVPPDAAALRADWQPRPPAAPPQSWDVPLRIAAPAAPAHPPMARAGTTATPSAGIQAARPDHAHCPPPAYPSTARRLGLGGTVLLRVLVSDGGHVEEIRLANSSGHSLLDEAAQAAVRRWRFIPARRGGMALAAWVEVPVEFDLRQAR